jgi:hypothetical protein
MQPPNLAPETAEKDVDDRSAASIDFYRYAGGELYYLFHGKKYGNIYMGLVGNHVCEIF